MAATTSLVSSSSCLGGSLLFPQNFNHRGTLLSFTITANSRQCNRICVKHKISYFRRKAALRENLGAIGAPTSVPVRVAHELLQAGHRYLDVRTPDEFYVGHAPGAINIPYMYRVGSGMSKNHHFLEEVSSHFRKYNEIIVGCQSGKRSMLAATDLLAAGYTGITDIAGGYAAWTRNELPNV